MEVLIGELELGGVLDVLGVEERMDFHDRGVPFEILLEEEGVSIGVKGGPHRRVVAEAEDEEVAGSAPEKDVERDADFGYGLLWDRTTCGVMEYRFGEQGGSFRRGGRRGEGGGGGEIAWHEICFVAGDMRSDEENPDDQG